MAKMVRPEEISKKDELIKRLKKELGTTREEWRRHASKYQALKNTMNIGKQRETNIPYVFDSSKIKCEVSFSPV